MSRESRATAVALLLLWMTIGIFSPMIALIVAPAFALFFVLSLGFFPGERLIEKIRENSRPSEWSRPVAVPEPSSEGVIRPVGLRLAFALAVRPPPAHL